MRLTLLRLFRLTLYAGFTLPMMAVQLLLLRLGGQAMTSFPRWYHRVCCRILGFRVVVRGAMSPKRPTLFVANHASYTDITVLGATIAGSFVAKAEVARWPFFGWLAKLQRTVFVDRKPRTTHVQRDALSQRLEDGDDLILFPEGTSNDGLRVLPFKSALFSVAEYRAHGEPLAVQPVTVAYTRLDGMPIGRAWRPLLAWYGGMDLGPHLWTLVGLGIVTVVVEFHPVVTIAEFGSRKALSDHCRRVIAEGLATALSGHKPESLQPVARAA